MEQQSGRRWLTTKEAAYALNFSVPHLKRLRYRGNGPPCRRIGRAIRYCRDEIEAWMRAQEAVVG